MQLSEQLARYFIPMYGEAPDPEVRALALAFLGDTFSVMLAGSVEPASRLTAEYAVQYAKPGSATIAASPDQGVDAYFAAMANGTAAHAHDFDDVCTTMIGHPSVAILPAVLALAEEQALSGEQALRGYIVGVEACALLGRLLCPELNKRGWHSTETIGVLGAAIAAGCLLDLDEAQMANAIGIAVSEACGVKENYGTMSKPLHAGRAAAKGIFAARLAKRGFTASPNALDGEAGYIAAFVGTSHPEAMAAAMERRNSEFLDAGLTMKPWPCCKGMHNAIWAMMELMEAHHWSPADIDHIDCRVLPFAKDILIYEIARTPLEGKFSMNYAIAKVVLQQRLTMGDFRGDLVDDPAVIDMMHKVHMLVDRSLISGGGYYDASECEQVDVYLKNGETYSNFCAKAKGTPDNPMSLEERRSKMIDCISCVIAPERIPDIVSMLERFDSLPRVSQLFDAVRAGKMETS